MSLSTETLEVKLDGFRELVEERFDSMCDSHTRIEEQLKTMNSQVAKNTTFRIRAKVYAGVLLATLTFLVPVIQSLVRDAISSYL